MEELEIALEELDQSISSLHIIPKVYFIPSISRNALIEIYKKLSWKPSGGNVAVNISTGESKYSNHLDPLFIHDLVWMLKGTIVECNTAYEGNRHRTQDHYKTIHEHGYDQNHPVKILAEFGSMAIPVYGGKHLQYNMVGEAIQDFPFYVILSHFKGHPMAGLGGAIKNMSIGLASAEGKSLIHSAGKDHSGVAKESDAFLESMAEAAKSIVDFVGKDNIIYINVMNNLSVDCDCLPHPAKPTMKDIGILASHDPVALDKACYDLIMSAKDGKDLQKRIQEKNGLYTIEYADQIGLGSLKYELIIDNETK